MWGLLCFLYIIQCDIRFYSVFVVLEISTVVAEAVGGLPVAKAMPRICSQGSACMVFNNAAPIGGDLRWSGVKFFSQDE